MVQWRGRGRPVAMVAFLGKPTVLAFKMADPNEAVLSRRHNEEPRRALSALPSSRSKDFAQRCRPILRRCSVAGGPTFLTTKRLFLLSVVTSPV